MKHQTLLLAVLAAPLAMACPAIRPPPPDPAPSPTTTSVAVVVSESAVASSSAVVVDPAPVVVPSDAMESSAPAATSTLSPIAENPTPATTFVTSVAPAATSSTGSAATPGTPAVSDDAAAVSGESTFYGGNLSGGMCSFSTYTLPAGLYGTAFSGSAWNSAANCGACVKVTGPNGNSITAMIVDQCPECDATHLDLFQNAFEQLGPISAGIIETSYEFVPCGISSPIVLHNKSGTSQYWFSMQVVNANEPVASLQVSTDGGGTWKQTTRRDYNFFENPSGFGTSTVDVKVTSTNGKSIVVKGVSVASDTQVTASSNF